MLKRKMSLMRKIELLYIKTLPLCLILLGIIYFFVGPYVFKTKDKISLLTRWDNPSVIALNLFFIILIYLVGTVLIISLYFAYQEKEEKKYNMKQRSFKYSKYNVFLKFKNVNSIEQLFNNFSVEEIDSIKWQQDSKSFIKQLIKLEKDEYLKFYYKDYVKNLILNKKYEIFDYDIENVKNRIEKIKNEGV